MTNQFFSAPRFITSGRLWLATVALLLVSFSASFAQEPPAPEAAFAQVPTAEVYVQNADNRLRKDEAEISNMWEGITKLEEAKFDAYFTYYVFARMTQLDKLAQLETMRMQFLNQFLLKKLGTIQENEKEVAQIAYDHLVVLTLDTMQKIVNGNFHPAVRYNALLVIGRLDASRPVIPLTVPQPSSVALNFMVGQLGEVGQNDAMLLAAWVGILRHTSLDRHNGLIDNTVKETIRAHGIQLLQQREPPMGRSLAGHVWLQRRAIEVLGVLGPDPNKQGLNAIAPYIQDKTSFMSLRLTAARSLKYYCEDNQTAIPTVSAAHSLGALAVQACQNEIARVEAAKKRKNNGQDYGNEGMGGADGMEGMMMEQEGGMASMFEGGGGNTASKVPELKPAEANRVQLTRRRLKYQLYHVQQGLGTDGPNSDGLLAASDVQAKAEVQEVLRLVNEIMNMDELKEPEIHKTGTEKGKPIETVKLEDIIKNVRRKARDLEKHVTKASKPAQPGEAPAEPADAPGSD